MVLRERSIPKPYTMWLIQRQPSKVRLIKCILLFFITFLYTSGLSKVR